MAVVLIMHLVVVHDIIASASCPTTGSPCIRHSDSFANDITGIDLLDQVLMLLFLAPKFMTQLVVSILELKVLRFFVMFELLPVFVNFSPLGVHFVNFAPQIGQSALINFISSVLRIFGQSEFIDGALQISDC